MAISCLPFVLRAVWLGLCVLMLLGCAGGAQPPASGTAEHALAPESLLAGLPPLPIDEPPLRAAGDTTVATQNGSDALLLSDGAEVSGADLIITSAAHKLEYAIYRFEAGLSETGTYETTATLTLDPGHEVWLALADYDHRRWVLSGPYSDSIVRPLDDGVFLSPYGNFYLAVLAYGGSAVTVSAASFSFDNGVRPPGS